jgi:hypothetical protein
MVLSVDAASEDESARVSIIADGVVNSESGEEGALYACKRDVIVNGIDTEEPCGASRVFASLPLRGHRSLNTCLGPDSRLGCRPPV